MDDRPFYYRVRGRTLGPVPLRQIRQLAQRAQIGRATDISRDGLQWGKAGDWPEIFEVGQGAAPPGAGFPFGDLQVNAEPEPSAPTVVGQNWYYAVGGVQQGPVPLATLQQMVATGQLSRSDHVFPDGGTDWLIVSNVPQLSGGAGVPAGPPQTGFAGGGNRAFCRACGASVHEQAVICPQCGVATGSQQVISSGGRVGGTRSGDRKEKMMAALLAFLLGGLGAHHFYLGNAGLGVMYLLFCWTFIPALVALIEAIMFVCMSDEAFNAKYNS